MSIAKADGVAAPRMGIEDTLHAILDALQAQVADRGTDRVSSISIEDMAKGPPKIVSKFYAGSPLTREEVDEALDVHGYAHREAERRAMAGWAETVEALSLQASKKVMAAPGPDDIKQFVHASQSELEALPDFGASA